MDPSDDRIRAYIHANRERFTAEAVRSELVAAGHDPGRVDEILSEDWSPAPQRAAVGAEQPAPVFGGLMVGTCLGAYAIATAVAGVPR